MQIEDNINIIFIPFIPLYCIAILMTADCGDAGGCEVSIIHHFFVAASLMEEHLTGPFQTQTSITSPPHLFLMVF